MPTDYDAVGRPTPADMATLSSPLSTVLTDELAGSAAELGVGVDVILIAALGRTVQRTIGDGAVSVDVPSRGATVQALSVPCAPPTQTSATDLVAGVHQALAALTLQRIVHGAFDDSGAQPPSNILFVYGDAVLERAHLGHVLELHASHDSGVLHLRWRYDVRSFDPYTVQELGEQFPLALIEVTSEAAPPLVVTTELAMAN